MDRHINAATVQLAIGSVEQEVGLSSQKSSNDDAPTFPLFSKLAVELQILIWKFSYHPQLLKMEGRRKDKSQTLFDCVLNTSPPPSMLHVCQVSRSVALKMYALIEGDIDLVQRPMYYNRFRDIILLENVSCMELLLRKPLSIHTHSEHERPQALLGHIAVSVEWPFGLLASLPSHVVSAVFREFSDLCDQIFSNTSAFTTSQHITLIKPFFAIQGPPSQIAFPFAPSRLAIEVQPSWAVRSLQLLTRNGAGDCQGYLDAFILRAAAMEVEFRKSGVERVEMRYVTLTCCTLKELEDGNPMGCKRRPE